MKQRWNIELRLKETDLKKHCHTQCDLCVEVEESVELKSSIEVKESIDTKMKH